MMTRAMLKVLMSVFGLAAAGCCGASDAGAAPSTGPIALPVADNAASMPLQAFAFPGPGYGEQLEAGASALTDAQALACFDGEDISADASMSLALVEVRGDGVKLWGRDVMALQAGAPLDDQRKGLMLAPLYDALLAPADDMKAWAARGCTPWALEGEEAEFQGRLLVAAEPGVPMDTVTAVVYTAGQAQFSQVAFWVEDSEPVDGAAPWPILGQGADPWPMVTLDPAALQVTAGETHVTLPCLGGRCDRVSDHDWAGLEEALGAASASDDPALMIGLPGSAPFAAWVRAADIARGLSEPQWPVLVQPVEDVGVALSVGDHEAAPRPVAPQGRVAVLRALQPQIVAPVLGEVQLADDELVRLVSGIFGGEGLGSRENALEDPADLPTIVVNFGPTSVEGPLDPGTGSARS